MRIRGDYFNMEHCPHNGDKEICRVCNRPKETLYWKDTDRERVERYQKTIDINIGYTNKEKKGLF